MWRPATSPGPAKSTGSAAPASVSAKSEPRFGARPPGGDLQERRRGLPLRSADKQVGLHGRTFLEVLGGLDQQGLPWGYTLSVWHPKEMVPFRDSGGHNFAMRFFSWIFFGGRAQAYFLTLPAFGRLPSPEEIPALARQFGRFYDRGKLVRNARPPKQQWYEVLP